MFFFFLLFDLTGLADCMICVFHCSHDKPAQLISSWTKCYNINFQSYISFTKITQKYKVVCFLILSLPRTVPLTNTPATSNNMSGLHILHTNVNQCLCFSTGTHVAANFLPLPDNIDIYINASASSLHILDAIMEHKFL